MARRVYDKGGASSEEISDILKLLRQNNIPHYETPTGILGLSPGAIWVSRDSHYREARRLIEDYDRSRAHRVREEYAKRAAEVEGSALIRVLSNIWKLVSQNSQNVLLYTVIIAFLIMIHWLFYRAISQL